MQQLSIFGISGSCEHSMDKSSLNIIYSHIQQH